MTRDHLAELALAGATVTGERVVDAHCHMGPWYNFHIPRNDAAGMAASMDRVGTQTAICAAHASIGPDYRLGNEQVAQAIADFPGRFLGYITLNPHYPAAELRRELRERHNAGGFVGIKLHCGFHQAEGDDERYRPAWEFAHEHGLPVLVHTYRGPQAYDALAERYPNAKIMIAHSISDVSSAEATTALAKRRPNVYLDICGSPLLYGMLEWAVGQVGAERVLFGTDLPFIDCRPGLGRLLMSRLSPDEKRLIMGLNAARVFGLP